MSQQIVLRNIVNYLTQSNNIRINNTQINALSISSVDLITFSLRLYVTNIILHVMIHSMVETFIRDTKIYIFLKYIYIAYRIGLPIIPSRSPLAQVIPYVTLIT